MQIHRDVAPRKCAASCPVCGSAVTTKRTGRKRKFCSHRCRDEAWRNWNFAADALKKLARYPHSGDRRNDGNSLAISGACQGQNQGRGSVDKHLWHRILTTEVFAAHRWSPTVSIDGVASQVAILNRSPLVRP